MPKDWWWFAVDALAVFRLTRLFTRDTITESLRNREWMLQTRGIQINIGLAMRVFLTCPWCVSVWFAAGVVALTVEWSWWIYPAAALAFSAIAGIVEERT